MTKDKIKKILTIAGSDSSGGAGIQADIKTITTLGHYAMSAITAITAQNTMGVHEIYPVSNDAIRQQIEDTVYDIKPDAVKIGMIVTVDQAMTIKNSLKKQNIKFIVIDPVLTSTSGDDLSDGKEVYEQLFDIADFITPNIPEAEILLDHKIKGPDEQKSAAVELCKKYNCGVILKGGHLRYPDDNGNITLVDVFCNKNGELKTYEREWIDNNNTHGTGCTLSSALCCKLAEEEDKKDKFDEFSAMFDAVKYVTGAIEYGYNIGHGRGPLYHAYLYAEDRQIEDEIPYENTIEGYVESLGLDPDEYLTHGGKK